MHKDIKQVLFDEEEIRKADKKVLDRTSVL